jgi:Peptide methionine sulfoxide reductase
MKASGITVTTEVTKAKNFYKAEEYHQDYLTKNPGGYCHINLNTIHEF